MQKKGYTMQRRAMLVLAVMMFLGACALPSPASLPEIMSEKQVRPDHRERIAHRLLWLAPELPWHYNCLFMKPIAQLDHDEQKLALPSADLLFRAHFEEERMAYRSAGYLYRQAADQGIALAYVKLGNLLIGGKGAKPNPEGGAKLILQSARLECAQAQYRYGELLTRGIGVKTDLVQAWGWVYLAQQKGYPKSAALLKRMEPFMGPSQISLAKQNAETLQHQLNLFNQGPQSQALVRCVTPRIRKPFITRMRACHAMGGSHMGEPIDYRTR
ncbi:tetratricopeptide repeat protein [Terasakiella sp. SH-1]|uniref:tetratricopeptide repeat protein n=1 Tax=Terasakiella sp. SH-1 TaxID=2560057 RepID=UPI0010730FA3|nr:tetratricopeptide repeat protein [Terasakiella sp. SH-1]